MMRRPPYINMLTAEERAVSIKLGMVAALTNAGLPADWLVPATGTVKQAQFRVPSAGDVLRGSAGTMLALSLLLGAPLGAAAHAVERRVKGETPEEKERLRRIQHYRDLTHQLSFSLGKAGGAAACRLPERGIRPAE